jgi:hypothetical protein
MGGEGGIGCSTASLVVFLLRCGRVCTGKSSVQVLQYAAVVRLLMWRGGDPVCESALVVLIYSSMTSNHSCRATLPGDCVPGFVKA